MSKIYRKLAFQNIKNNKEIYIPYIITSSITIFMYYIFLAIQNSKDILNSRGGEYVVTVLGMGEFIITIFSVIFLIYTNKFLVRNRDRELGLINMLGVDKKGISKIMIYENILLTLTNLVVGISTSMIFSTVIFRLIGKYLNISLSHNFYIDFKSIAKTIVVYLMIFLVVLVGNIIRVRRLKPLDLLKESEKGEREPKANIILTLMGIACLVIGYYLANSIGNVLDAIIRFFVAVVFVIIGTYILFTTISVAILKMLKRNKRIYYKSSNMTFISSLMYRMKQNAVSLANICILSTMVLVMIVSSASLIASKDYFINEVIPSDMYIDFNKIDSEVEKDVENIININIDKNNLNIKKSNTIHGIGLGAKEENGQFEIVTNNEGMDMTISVLNIYDLKEYKKVSNENIKLENNEAILYSNKGNEFNDIKIGEFPLKIKENKKNIAPEFKNMVMDLFSTYTVVVNDKNFIYNADVSGYKPESFGGLIGTGTKLFVDVEGTDAEINSVAKNIEKELLTKYPYTEEFNMSLTNKVEASRDFVAMHSGIFLVTILLSVLFLVATVMIIYYKQLSEGMEDAKNTSILSKIGMGKKEIKKNLAKQTRVVFFAPLAVAIIHLIGASDIIYNIMKVIGIGNKSIFIKVEIITVLIYSVLYMIIYKITSNSYFKTTQKTN